MFAASERGQNMCRYIRCIKVDSFRQQISLFTSCPDSGGSEIPAISVICCKITLHHFTHIFRWAQQSFGRIFAGHTFSSEVHKPKIDMNVHSHRMPVKMNVTDWKSGLPFWSATTKKCATSKCNCGISSKPAHTQTHKRAACTYEQWREQCPMNGLVVSHPA